MKPRVAVIDVGSNSIKALVAEREDSPFGIRTVFEETLEVRISAGISGHPPMLQDAAIKAGSEAVDTLACHCRRHGRLRSLCIVATSAVRSAVNGQAFADEVLRRTGIPLRILSGEEEAEGIALGVRTDSSIQVRLSNFTIFDLGGGSLELIRFRRNRIDQRTSLPLGSVRLTERFFIDPSQAIPVAEQENLQHYVREQVSGCGVSLKPPLVGCGGALAVMHRHFYRGLGEVEPLPAIIFKRKHVERGGAYLSGLTLIERIERDDMPANRADIMPAALLTIAVIMQMARTRNLLHSYHNLRYGIAWRLLCDDLAG